MAQQQTQPQTPSIATAPADLKSLGSAFTVSSTQLVSSGAAMSAQVQAARLAGLKRAATAAAAAYGAQSKEATDASAAVAVAQARTGQLQVAAQKASTPTPAVAPTSWALHGRVYDASQNPQERYTVFLVDAQKNYLSEYGFSYTDSTGYFLINYPGPANQSASNSKPSGLGAASTSSGSTPPEAYIQVYDANANPVISSTSPFTPVIGQARYQVLTLPAAKQTLGDPPAEVRAVATPQTTATAAATTPAAMAGKTKQKSTEKKSADKSKS
jgi:hypothetical protein